MGGFGPQLRQFIVAAHYQGQVTSERLVSLLNGMGLDISKRQVVRFLSEGLEDLIAEDQDVLKAGLETASWISVDDTSARHKRQDEFTTQFGDDRFTVFRTGPTKSRRRFLYDLQCGRQDYVIDEVAFAYMQRLKLPEPLISKLRAHPSKRFNTEVSFEAHLKMLGFDGIKIAPDPTRVATEAALWAAVKEQGLLDGTVVVSDGAGQFRVEDQALCWIHSERLIYKLQPANIAHQKAVDLVRALIWWFLSRSEGLQALSRSKTGTNDEGPLRSDIYKEDRLHPAGPAAQTPPPSQGTLAAGAGAARNPASHKRLGKRHPLHGDQAQNIRRNHERRR